MENIIAIAGDDFIIMAADGLSTRSIIVLRDDFDKILNLDDRKILGAVGEQGDRHQFSQYIQKNIHLYQYRTGIKLNTAATANFTRGELATSLRSSSPFNVNVLLGGYDKSGPELYFIDYLASMHKVNYGAHGYTAMFVYGILDKGYRKGLSVNDGLNLIQQCIHEVRTRFLVKPPNFIVKVLDKDGIRVIQ
eukprot:TRINITY_DN8828_c0_g1_i1.p1 TRINITY_DN8828_c0_g1~~TRINITY_DN8828_c0_g1_i1.p1  ORF type:complete len:192 (-),score=32.33 TRINITY_DN8828_c0_g1_i1:59-634(-)